MMNKILYGLGIALLLVGISCQKDDAPTAQPARPHAEVYPENLALIEEFLQNSYVEVERDANGDVINVVIDTLNPSHTVSIWNQTEYPLQHKIVKLYGVDFKVYYLKLDNKGDTDADGEKPCGVDRIMTTYWGKSISKVYKALPEPHYVFSIPKFDESPNEIEFNLIDLVKGWEHMMPLFRAGQTVPDPSGDGTLVHTNYGSGVMFLPSGLGYYNGSGSGNIPYYAPLIFSVNLHRVTRLDQDFDKIESRYEYVLNDDGTLLDTDGDGIPDLFDADDDNDGYLTKDEIKIGNAYPAFNDILNCSGTTGGIKKHLDASCH